MVAAIVLNPTHAKVGTSVLITGSSFTALATPVSFTYAGTPIVPTDGPISVGAGGDFTAHITIPASVEGIHNVVADDGTTNANADFIVDPFISISPTTQKINGTIDVVGSGFATASLVTLLVGGVDKTPVTHITDATGGFTFTGIVVPTLASGTQVVDAEDAALNDATANLTVSAPTLTRSPTNGPVGQVVLLNGSNYIPGHLLTITNTDGSTSTVTANGSGDIPTDTPITIPDSPQGNHNITVSDGTNSAVVVFTVNSSFSISPVSGNIASTPIITAKGLAAASAVTVDFAGTDVTPGGSPVSDSKGTYTHAITVPTITSGAKTVTITDASLNAPTTTFTVHTVPLAPTLDTVLPISDTELDLSWTAPADTGAVSITGYKIERNINGAGWTVKVANTGNAGTTYHDTSLAHNQSVAYRISAINSVGTGPVSNIVTAATWVVPTAPVIVLDDLGATDYTIEFPEPASPDVAITGYVVQTSEDVGFSSPDSDNVAYGDDPTIFQKTSLTGLTEYWIRVKAQSSIGDSLWSNVLHITTESTLPIIAFTTHTDFTKFLKSYKEGSKTSIPVNDDDYNDSAMIDMRGCSELMVQIKNTHATNGLTYALYGTCEEVDAGFSYDAARYSVVDTGTGNIAALANIVKIIPDVYSWILVRTKRQISLNDSTADIIARQKQ